MPLFHPRVVASALEKTASEKISDSHLAILTAWAESITSGSILKQKETALHGHFIQQLLLQVLGYKGFEGGKESWNLQREQQVGKGSVDVAFGTFGTDVEPIILAPFELKGAKTKDLDAIMPGRHKSPVQQAWEYAMDAPGAKWVLVSNYLEIRLYAVGYGRQDYERFDLAELATPEAYHRLRLFLSAENLLGGRTRALLKESDKVGKDITNKLYHDYKHLRENLIRSLKADNPAVPELEIISHAQTILDRVLFVAFAEDQTLLPEHTLEKAFTHQDPYNPRPVWENFKGLFRAIDKGNPSLHIPAYNGGLFRHDPAIDDLTVSDAICEGFKQLGEYDFNSEVSVTVLGHIFEQSITDLEALQAEVTGEEVEVKAKATTGKRKREGVVYTPDSITRFIVEQTLGRHLEKQFEALWQQHENPLRQTRRSGG